jgi:hypothetical protein
MESLTKRKENYIRIHRPPEIWYFKDGLFCLWRRNETLLVKGIAWVLRAGGPFCVQSTHSLHMSILLVSCYGDGMPTIIHLFCSPDICMNSLLLIFITRSVTLMMECPCQIPALLLILHQPGLFSWWCPSLYTTLLIFHPPVLFPWWWSANPCPLLIIVLHPTFLQSWWWRAYLYPPILMLTT